REGMQLIGQEAVVEAGTETEAVVAAVEGKDRNDDQVELRLRHRFVLGRAGPSHFYVRKRLATTENDWFGVDFTPVWHRGVNVHCADVLPGDRREQLPGDLSPCGVSLFECDLPA